MAVARGVERKRLVARVAVVVGAAVERLKKQGFV